MPNRVQWEPAFAVGDALIDAQHQGLLNRCNSLADLCPAEGETQPDRLFDLAFEGLKALVREHFEAEATWFTSRGDLDLEDHRAECDEFEYLAGEIATAENFSRLELQRFVAVWCVGHILDTAERQRALLADGNTPA